MNPIDRAIILDEAKQYTNSQRIAYMEGQADITFDGNIEGKEIIPGSSLVKVSDTAYDLTKVKAVTQRLNNGTYATVAADAFTFEGADGAAYLLYGNDMCVVSSQKGSIFDEDAGVVGTFVLAVGSTWISKVEFAKTIHPIDPKFLPGVCLPVVELSTTVANGAVFTAEENAKLTAAFAEGVPIVLNCSLDSQGEGIKAESFAGVAYRAISDGMNMFVLYMGQTFVIMSEDGLNWVAGIE